LAGESIDGDVAGVEGLDPAWADGLSGGAGAASCGGMAAVAGIVSNANKKHGNACRISEIPRMAMGGSEAEIFNYDSSFEAVCNGVSGAGRWVGESIEG
jgi:hypothetical protein